MIKKIAIIWLGYVWLPLAYHFDLKWFEVIWYDISSKKIDELRNWIDTTKEIWDKIKDSKIKFTKDINDIKESEIIIITVPTPIDSQKNPDFVPLQKSSEAVGKVLQSWQIVVYESTVYPWCTEDICLPLLEKNSWLKCPQDFQIWYSPERINPWDTLHTVDKIVKVVSGINDNTANTLAKVYWEIISAGIHIAPSIKVAEASKVIENTQRDINIALMNELTRIFHKIGINTFDVLEAAGTKWNFLKFTPWLVWWHCIGVDPYWLAYLAEWVGLNPEVILSGRRINDNTAEFVAHNLIKMMLKSNKPVNWSKVLILWLTFKEDVPDFRNSKVADLISELKSYGVKINVFDPYYDYLDNHIMEELHITDSEIIKDIKWKYDWIVYAVNHKEFENIDIGSLLTSDSALFDIKGKFRKSNFANYMSL